MVAWCDAFGSYAEQVCVPRDRMVAVPESLEPHVAASMLLQGITAHYLTHGVYNLSEGDSCLITAGAGGVGLLATQMAASAGATVYSVVSSEEKLRWPMKLEQLRCFSIRTTWLKTSGVETVA